MGDVDDADAARREPLDDTEEGALLLGSQRGGRLVHEDDARVERHRLGDFEQLHLREAQVAHVGVGVEVDFQFRENLLAPRSHRRLVAHAQPREQPVSMPRIAAQKQVALHVHEPHEAEFLVNNADAQFTYLRGRSALDGAALEVDLTGVFSMRPDMILMRVDLPGAVLAQKHVHLARAHLKVHVRQGHDTGNSLPMPRMSKTTRPAPRGCETGTSAGDGVMGNSLAVRPGRYISSGSLGKRVRETPPSLVTCTISSLPNR